MDSVHNLLSTKLPDGVTFKIPEVTRDYVFKSLISLDCTKATGLDEISAYFLKLSAAEITESITHVLNCSIQGSIVPTQWKKSKVIPIFKSDSTLEVSNYRPISILPVLSKILEHHVHDALTRFLNAYGLIRESQSGFREGHSCETALLKIIDDWNKSIDSGYLIGSVFLDLRKAFDLVNHSILIDKLSAYGLSDLSVAWFRSYLSNRKQVTCVDGVISPPMSVTCGVPQGSILGPLLFVLYLNDMDQVINHCSAGMYADDTTLYVKGKSTVDLNMKINEDMAHVSKWCNRNKMVINRKKTKCMLVGSRQRLATMRNNSLNITVEDINIENVHCE